MRAWWNDSDDLQYIGFHFENFAKVLSCSLVGIMMGSVLDDFLSDSPPSPCSKPPSSHLEFSKSLPSSQLSPGPSSSPTLPLQHGLDPATCLLAFHCTKEKIQNPYCSPLLFQLAFPSPTILYLCSTLHFSLHWTGFCFLNRI